MRRLAIRKRCSFCGAATLPDFTQFENLQKFTSERGKILSRTRTGTCAKHQRLLSKAVKTARFLSLIPFTAKI